MKTRLEEVMKVGRTMRDFFTVSEGKRDRCRLGCITIYDGGMALNIKLRGERGVPAFSEESGEDESGNHPI